MIDRTNHPIVIIRNGRIGIQRKARNNGIGSVFTVPRHDLKQYVIDGEFVFPLQIFNHLDYRRFKNNDFPEFKGAGLAQTPVRYLVITKHKRAFSITFLYNTEHRDHIKEKYYFLITDVDLDNPLGTIVCGCDHMVDFMSGLLIGEASEQKINAIAQDRLIGTDTIFDWYDLDTIVGLLKEEPVHGTSVRPQSRHSTNQNIPRRQKRQPSAQRHRPSRQNSS